MNRIVPQPARPRSDFVYDPNTGALRWNPAISTHNHLAGRLVGSVRPSGRTSVYIHGYWYDAAWIARWVATGEFRTDVYPADGNWSNLAAKNLAVRRRKYRTAKPDHFNVSGRENLLGPDRLSSTRAKILLKIASARQYDHQNQCWVRRPVSFDELTEILWPDPDSAPLCAKNNISAHVCQINKLLSGWRIVRAGPGYNVGFTLKEIKS